MLVLPIRKKWFDMILSGEKKEEYREIKPYYKSRFKTAGLLDQYGLPTISNARIAFRNGYSAGSPTIETKCTLDIKTGRPEWGAEPEKEYYVLKIETVERGKQKVKEERKKIKLISNAKYGEPVESGTIFRVKVGTMNVTIDRYVGCEGWFLSCPDLRIETKGLKSKGLLQATREAGDILKNRIENLKCDINVFCGTAIEISRY